MRQFQSLTFHGLAKMLTRFVLLSVALVLYPGLSSAQDLSITIKTTWAGLGEIRNPITDVVISGNRGGYRVNGKHIEDGKVAAFLSAVDEPAVLAPSLENCGITPTWLERNQLKAVEDATPQKLKSLSPAQIDLFRSHYTDLRLVQTLLEKMFDSFHTDDFPQISVRISRKDADDILLESDSQYPWMLPWFGEPGTAGYNCHISQTLAALLPANAVNRSRLSVNDGFRYDLAQDVMGAIRDEWDKLDTDWHVGSQIAPILSRFDLTDTKLICRSSIDVDGCGWNATLSSPKLPTGLVVGVTLYRDQKYHLAGVGDFMRNIDAYMDLASSVPWLSSYVRQHPGISVEIRFVQDRSLSVNALKSLTEDLNKNGKSDLADRVIREKDAIVFLQVEETGRWSRWIVFPDRKMLLWHFQTDSALGFKSAGMKVWNYYGWNGAGILVSPEGAIVP
jgi:hypothetical protein